MKFSSNCTPLQHSPDWSTEPLAVHVTTWPKHGNASALFDHTAPAFAEIAAAQAINGTPQAVVERMSRTWSGTWLITARCPFCNGTHKHGGQAHAVPGFGHRVADCHKGRSYDLTIKGADRE